MNIDVETPRVFVHPDGRMDRKNSAIYLGCAAKTMADWAVKGIGPAYVLVGGRVFYFQSDLDDWINSKGKSASSSRPDVCSV